MVPLVAGPHHNCARQDKWHTLSRHAQCVMGQFVPLAWRIGLSYRRRKVQESSRTSEWLAKYGASFADASARPENGSKRASGFLKIGWIRGEQASQTSVLERLESQILIPQIQAVTASALAGISEHGRRGRHKDAGNSTQGHLTTLILRKTTSVASSTLDADPPHSRFAQRRDRQQRKPKLPATVPGNRASSAAGRNRSRSIAWAAKEENFQP
jgi:hypothetical protein